MIARLLHLSGVIRCYQCYHLSGVITKVTSERLKHLTDLVDSGAVKPHIDKVFSIEQTKQAFEHLEKGRPRGKVVVRIKN